MRKLFNFITYISTALANYRELTFQHVADDAKVTNNSLVLSTTRVQRSTGCFWDCINTRGCFFINILHHPDNNTFTCNLITEGWFRHKLEYALGYTFYSYAKRNFQFQLTHGPGFCISHENSVLKLDFCSSKYTFFQMDAFGRLMVGDLCVHVPNVNFVEKPLKLTEDCALGWMFDFVGTEDKSYIKITNKGGICMHVYNGRYSTHHSLLIAYHLCDYLPQTEFRVIEH